MLVVMFAILPACKKNNDTPDPTTTATVNQNLLKTWKASKVFEGTLDITAEFSQYRITFEEANGNKTYTLINRQGTSQTGTWDISADETSITLNATGGGSATLTKVSIAANEFKYTSSVQGKNGTVEVAFNMIPV